MSAQIYRKTAEDKKNSQSLTSRKRVKIEVNCAACGCVSPECILDERLLCMNCYEAETHFCEEQKAAARSPNEKLQKWNYFMN